MSHDQRFAIALALFALGFCVMMIGVDRDEVRRRRVARLREQLEQLERRQRIEDAVEQEVTSS